MNQHIATLCKSIIESFRFEDSIQVLGTIPRHRAEPFIDQLNEDGHIRFWLDIVYDDSYQDFAERWELRFRSEKLGRTVIWSEFDCHLPDYPTLEAFVAEMLAIEAEIDTFEDALPNLAKTDAPGPREIERAATPGG